MNTTQHLPSMRSACLHLGIKAVVAEFSGGNDEGGIDSMHGIPFDESQPKIEIEDCTDYYQPPGTPAPAHDRSHQAIWTHMAAQVYRMYGTFAGDFHASGQFVYDLSTGETKQSGRYTESQTVTYGDDDLPF